MQNAPGICKLQPELVWTRSKNLSWEMVCSHRCVHVDRKWLQGCCWKSATMRCNKGWKGDNKYLKNKNKTQHLFSKINVIQLSFSFKLNKLVHIIVPWVTRFTVLLYRISEMSNFWFAWIEFDALRIQKCLCTSFFLKMLR